MTEFNLSEKIIVLKAELGKTLDTDKTQRYAEMQDMGVSAQDIKEFIRLLKVYVDANYEIDFSEETKEKIAHILKMIDKLAGDKLK